MLNESAIQKLTKEMWRHCRRAGSTGFKSWLVRKSCLLVKPGSASVCYHGQLPSIYVCRIAYQSLHP